MQTSRLRQWRTKAGLTLRECSDLTDVSAEMWSRVERGEKQFAPMTKVRVARALGVRISDLFEPEVAAPVEHEPAA